MKSYVTSTYQWRHRNHLLWFLDTWVEVHSSGQLKDAPDGWKCYISASACRWESAGNPIGSALVTVKQPIFYKHLNFALIREGVPKGGRIRHTKLQMIITSFKLGRFWWFKTGRQLRASSMLYYWSIKCKKKCPKQYLLTYFFDFPGQSRLLSGDTLLNSSICLLTYLSD